MDKKLKSCFAQDPTRASTTEAAQSAGASAFSSSVWTVTCRFIETARHASSSRSITLLRRLRSVSRTSTLRQTRLGMLLTAPGNTSHVPTVATVSTAPLERAAVSRAKINSAAAQRASRRSGIKTPPACPPAPSIVMRALAGAAMLCTTPRGIFRRSRMNPCSMWSSTNAA